MRTFTQRSIFCFALMRAAAKLMARILILRRKCICNECETEALSMMAYYIARERTSGFSLMPAGTFALARLQKGLELMGG